MPANGLGAEIVAGEGKSTNRSFKMSAQEVLRVKWEEVQRPGQKNKKAERSREPIESITWKYSILYNLFCTGGGNPGGRSPAMVCSSSVRTLEPVTQKHEPLPSSPRSAEPPQIRATP